MTVHSQLCLLILIPEAKNGGRVVCAYNSSTQRLRQEDCHKFKVRLGYIVSSRSAWTIVLGPLKYIEVANHDPGPLASLPATLEL